MFSRSLLAASIAASCSFAVAAETTLATTVVTATRTTQSVDDSLASVQVITQEQLAQHPSQDLGDILRFATGIDVARLGGFGGQTSIFTRGTNSTHTLVLIDGVRINPSTNGQANIQNLTLSDVERVEIVKGAMSSLYGSDAIGGVINIITKTNNKTETYANLTAGKDKLVQGSINQKIKQGAFSALINANALYTDGYPITPKSTLNRGYKNQGGDIKTSYNVGSTTLSFTARENHGTTEYFNFGQAVSQDFSNQLISFVANGNLSSTINSQIRLSQMTDKIDQNNSSAIAHTKRQEADWQNTLAISPNITVIGGLTQNKTDAQYNSKYDKNQDNWAIYLQQESNFGQMDTQLSVRQDDYDSFGKHNTGNAALGFAINTQNRIYINYGTAFKAPNLNSLYDYGANPLLKPEESVSLEVGSKHSIGELSIKTAFFKTKIDNLINSVKTGTVPNPKFDSTKPIAWDNSPTNDVYTNLNIDKARSEGVELNVTWQHDGLFAMTNASYTHAQDDTTKQDLLRRPRRSLSFTTGYTQEKWGISSEILAKSHAFDFGQSRLAGYAVANIQAYVKVIPDSTLRLSINNITDKTYSFADGYLATPFTASISADVKF